MCCDLEQLADSQGLNVGASGEQWGGELVLGEVALEQGRREGVGRRRLRRSRRLPLRRIRHRVVFPVLVRPAIRAAARAAREGNRSYRFFLREATHRKQRERGERLGASGARRWGGGVCSWTTFFFPSSSFLFFPSFLVRSSKAGEGPLPLSFSYLSRLRSFFFTQRARAASRVSFVAMSSVLSAGLTTVRRILRQGKKAVECFQSLPFSRPSTLHALCCSPLSRPPLSLRFPPLSLSLLTKVETRKNPPHQPTNQLSSPSQPPPRPSGASSLRPPSSTT